MKTEAELAAAAEDLKSAALALKTTLDVARRQRKRDRIYLALTAVTLAGLAALTTLSFQQSQDNGETLRILREVTGAESRAASDERLKAAINELDRRLSETITVAINSLRCDLSEETC